MGKYDYLWDWPAVEVYKEVLSGRISRFPTGFWERPEAIQNAAECIRYLIEEILRWEKEDIKKNFSSKTFGNNKLGGMRVMLFNTSFEAIDTAYPGIFNQWELMTHAPNKYWTLENRIRATKWLIEELLQWEDKDVKNNISRKIFKENGLIGVLNNTSEHALYKAIDDAYPDRFKHWEFTQVAPNYWNLETGIYSTKWLIEERLQWSDEDIKKNLSQKEFDKNGLQGMILVVFGGSPYKAISATYPNRFREWELSKVPNNYWNLETAAISTRWMIDEVLIWDDEKINNEMSYNIFEKNGLSGMLSTVFGGSSYKCMCNAYPNKDWGILEERIKWRRGRGGNIIERKTRS